MGRYRKLTEENVQFLREHVKEKTLKEWALFFDTSSLTIFNAIHGKEAYASKTGEVVVKGPQA